MAEFADTYRALVEPALEPGETLEGVLAANHQQSAFKGRQLAVGVTPTRLLIQPLSRRGVPDGPVQSIRREDVVKASFKGAGGNWATVEAAIADHAAVSLVLRTADGTKWKMMMMHGEGLFGRLGGGETQREGVTALAHWLEGLE